MTTKLETAVPATGDVQAGTLRADLAGAFALVVTDIGSINSENFTTQPFEGLLLQSDGSFWGYDSTDTISAHDGMTVIVVSGRRYKRKGNVELNSTVLDVSQTAPPGSPVLGDAYMLGAAPTGLWAGKAKNIATWTARGWVFRAPFVGMLIYNVAGSGFWFYDAGSIWQAGLPLGAIAAASLDATKLFDPFQQVIVEDARNSPPGSIPSAGVAYIVGGAPTGAFVGSTNKVARSNGVSYDFFQPVEGSTVYNKEFLAEYTYRSGTWGRAVAPAGVQQVKRITASNENVGTVGATLVYSAQTAALQSAVGRALRFTLFEFRYSFGTGLSGDAYTIGLYKDADSVATGELATISARPDPNAVALTAALAAAGKLQFIHTVGDALSHTWKIGLKRTAGAGSRTGTLYVDALIEEIQVV